MNNPNEDKNRNSKNETNQKNDFNDEEIQSNFNSLSKKIEELKDESRASFVNQYKFIEHGFDCHLESNKVQCDKHKRKSDNKLSSLKKRLKKEKKGPEDIKVAEALLEHLHDINTNNRKPIEPIKPKDFATININHGGEKYDVNEKIIANIKARKYELFDFKIETGERIGVKDQKKTKLTQKPEVYPYDLCPIPNEKLLVVNFCNHVEEDLCSPNLLIYGVEPVRIGKDNNVIAFKDKLKLLSVYDRFDDIKQIPDKLKEDLMVSRKIKNKNFRLRINGATTNKFNRIFLCYSYRLLVLIVDLEFNYKAHIDLIHYKSETRGLYEKMKSICFNNAFNNDLLFVSTFCKILVFEVVKNDGITFKNEIHAFPNQIEHMNCINNMFIINYYYSRFSYSKFHKLELKDNTYNLIDTGFFVNRYCAIGASNFKFYALNTLDGQMYWCDEKREHLESFNLLDPKDDSNLKGKHKEGSICVFNSKLLICDYDLHNLIIIDGNEEKMEE